MIWGWCLHLPPQHWRAKMGGSWSLSARQPNSINERLHLQKYGRELQRHPTFTSGFHGHTYTTCTYVYTHIYTQKIILRVCVWWWWCMYLLVCFGCACPCICLCRPEVDFRCPVPSLTPLSLRQGLLLN